MKRLRAKKPIDVSRSKKEPLAEGLQFTVPTDSAGRRLWSRMRNEEIVELAKKAMKDNGITGKRELCRFDSGLYQVLSKRGLISSIEFKERRTSWKDMSDEKLIQDAKELKKEGNIKRKTCFAKSHRGVYRALKKRGLLGEVGFEAKDRSWIRMSDEEIVELAKKVMREKNISGRMEFIKADKTFYSVLYKRALLEKVGFVEKQRCWRDMSDEEVLEVAKKLVEREKITGKHELRIADSGLHRVLEKRGLLEEIGFEEKRVKHRSWKDMNNNDIVEFAKKVIHNEGISGRYELNKHDSGLYSILNRRRLINRVFAHIDLQRIDNARNAVIDALEAFGAANDNATKKDDVA